jgi:hypothetical protein
MHDPIRFLAEASRPLALRAVAVWDGWLVPVTAAHGRPVQQIVIADGHRFAVAFSSPAALARWSGPTLADQTATVDGRTLAASVSDDLAGLLLDHGSDAPITVLAGEFGALREAATAARATRLLSEPAPSDDALRAAFAHPAWRVLQRGDTLDVAVEDQTRLVVCSGDDAVAAWVDRLDPALPPPRVLRLTSIDLLRGASDVASLQGLIFDPAGPGPTVRASIGLAHRALALLG